MAVLSANRKYHADGKWNSDGSRSYTEVWQVITNSKDDHASTVLLAADLPLFWSTFAAGNSFDNASFVKSKSAKLINREEEFNHWEVQVEYNTVTEDRKESEDPENPESDQADVQWGFTEITEAMDTDEYVQGGLQDGHYRWPTLTDFATSELSPQGLERQSEAVLNTAHEPFDPPLERSVWVQTLSIARNEAQFDYTSARGYIGHINTDPIFSAGKFQVKNVGISGARQRKGPHKFDRVTYEFHIHIGDRQWVTPILSTGYNTWNAAAGTGTKSRILIDGELPGSPQLLDVDGILLVAPGSTEEAKAVYVPIYPYKITDFNALDLDQHLNEAN